MYFIGTISNFLLELMTFRIPVPFASILVALAAYIVPLAIANRLGIYVDDLSKLQNELSALQKDEAGIKKRIEVIQKQINSGSDSNKLIKRAQPTLQLASPILCLAAIIIGSLSSWMFR